ncbi:hypothetical protein PIB30_046534 [Stylosanthes scabra]|uniref:Uncharacterized protein n=1 Tax=Stylosanthes scabra TaxID=79078 RepID=A0ABU6RH78_9FABA|nr:hypothetical protein [Stylosanthes scabra]
MAHQREYVEYGRQQQLNDDDTILRIVRKALMVLSSVKGILVEDMNATNALILRRPRVRLKRKCVDLEHKKHGFHKVT